MDEIEFLAFNLNEKINKEIEQTIENKALMLYDFSLEFKKYQLILFLKDNTECLLNYNIPTMELLSNLFTINNPNPVKQKYNESNNQKESNFLNKKRFKTEPVNRQVNFSAKQTIKNKKVVFCHSDIILNNSLKNEEKAKKDTHLIVNYNSSSNSSKCDQSDDDSFARKSRGSIYRGVSRNGNQWQVLIMINKRKLYIGTYSTEEQAAKAYDVVALRNHGKKAKTNFYYTTQEVESII